MIDNVFVCDYSIINTEISGRIIYNTLRHFPIRFIIDFFLCKFFLLIFFLLILFLQILYFAPLASFSEF